MLRYITPVSLFVVLGCGDNAATSTDTHSDAADATEVSADSSVEDTTTVADTAPDVAETSVADTVEDGDTDALPGVELQGWRVVANDPIYADGKVGGSVTFVRDSGAETRGGGACLVADLYDTPCETRDDCLDLPLLDPGGYQYCFAADGGEKRCWTRPGAAGCIRAPSRTPGTYDIEPVPALVGAAPTTWMTIACMAVEDNPAGCAGDATQHIYDTSGAHIVDQVVKQGLKIYGADGNLGDYLADAFSEPGALAGLCGTSPGAPPPEDFEARLFAYDDTLEGSYYAAETYDAVVIAALAAESARDTTSAGLLPFMQAVTTGGDKCTSFAACRALLDDGKDIDYDGISGPLELDAVGEPALAYYTFLQFGQDNLIDESLVRGLLVGDPSRASDADPTLPARDATPLGGPLRLGALLPLTGSLDVLGPIAQAAAELAIADINAAGGVNGVPIELSVSDSGDIESDLAQPAVAAFIEDDVPVILGAISSAVTGSVIDDVVASGTVMISPANTGNWLTTYPDEGLYFRTVAPDTLQGRALAELLIADGRTQIGVLAVDDTYGLDLATALRSELVALGLSDDKITTITYEYDPLDIGPAVFQLQFIGVDAIVVLGFNELIDIIPALEAVGLGPSR